MTPKRTHILFFATAVLTVGCATSSNKEADRRPRTSYTEEAAGRDITNSAAKEVKAQDFAEIKFGQGESDLTKSSRASLDKLLSTAGHSGKIEEVIVMSWADEEFPSPKVSELPIDQRNLADKRNETIKTFLESSENVRVAAYNMAKQPNILSKWFNTTDNKLKKTLVAAGLPTTADDPQYPSKASHAVVLVKIAE